HKYINPGIYIINITIPPGTSSDPSITCGPLNQQFVVEVPNYRPDTYINTPPAPSPGSTVNSKDVTFTYGSNRNYVTFECSLDGSDFSECPSQGQTYSGLSDGQHQFKVRARDAGDNEDLSPATRTWTIDTTAPAAPDISNPSERSLVSAKFTVSGTAEAGSTVELSYGSVSRSAQTDSSGQWSIELVDLTEEPHSFKARATDAAGNVSADSETRTVIVDATRPTVKRVAPAENATSIAPGANVSALFSEATMEPASIKTSFKLYKKGSTTALAATVTYDPDTNRAVLNPRNNLKRGATYKAVVGAGVQDLAGNTLLDQDPNRAGVQPKVWFFTVRN
ncbi:MAG TPA: Ig-like domain-containing protein, partial [Rubrobacter sp.]|nr:Ig-like domain-containing protein [Rubrobacter sp.]